MASTATHAPNVNEQRFTLTGLDCASCARSVEKGVAGLPGVEGCEVDFHSARLRVRGGTPPEAVLRRVRELGFDGAPETPLGAGAGLPAGEAAAIGLFPYLLSRTDARLAMVGALLLLPGFLFHEILGWEGLWFEIPALLAVLLAGGPVVRTAWRGLRVNRELNIQALMTLAVVGALFIDAWVEAAMVVVLFSMGEALEGFAAARARGAIQSLMTVVPEVALRREVDGVEREVPVGALLPGDRILLRPGERIPMDGIVRSGFSAVDTSALTGEALPLERRAGEEVLAGSMNLEGSLEVEVTRPASETVLHRMIRLVEEALSARSPTQRFIDRFARRYTPAVVALAVGVAIVPPLAFGAPFLNPDPNTFGWFYRALALLVVACPCALVISVPVSVVSALTNAARHGVLIKGGAHLEALAGVRAVAFDKTGTLTESALAVVGVRSVDCAVPAADALDGCDSCNDLLALAAAVELRSEHPVGRAVLREAGKRLAEDRIPQATDHQALTGRGMTALLAGSGERVTIGSHRHFDLHIPHDALHCSGAHSAAEEGRIPLLVAREGVFLGTITLAALPRPTAREAIRELQAMGVETLLLSGDSAGAAGHIAREVGIERVEGDLLPEGKVDRLRELRARHGPVAMVGDGINDAPGLAVADVGIAMGGDLGGTDQAREAAAVTFLNPDLRALPRTLRLARAAMRTVRTNVAFAVGIKLAFLALVLLGRGTLWMAVLADVGATLVVTLYGLRLLRWDEGRPGGVARF
jgi:Zn2+/Cd2+-exporting ATPase